MNAGAFCDACFGAVAWLERPLCLRCGLPDLQGRCPSCRREAPAYAVARSAGLYQEPLARAIRQMKYQRRQQVAKALAPLLQAALDRWPELRPVELLIPVPIHPARERSRGFNQSELLAEALSRSCGAKLLPTTLTRPVLRPAQAGLSRAERLANLRGAFAVADPAPIKGRRVLLVDDVMTTGATLHEAAQALLAAGAARVAALTLAREP